MPKFLIAALLAACLHMAANPPCALAADLYGPNVKLRGDTILVTTGLNLDPQSMEDIQKGVSKEIVFFIDLYRVWQPWPDEFILGSRLTQNLHCDPVKHEYLVTSSRGHQTLKRRFSSCDQLLSWSMSLPDFKLTSTLELEPGDYFVRVSAESNTNRSPGFLTFIFFFSRQMELQLEGQSPPFTLEGRP